jgi:hypothetical protein
VEIKSESESDSESDLTPIKKPKMWYNQPFNTSWLSDSELKDWIAPDKTSRYIVKYKICDTTFTNANRSSLIAHKDTKNHKKNLDSLKKATKVDVYFSSANDKEPSLHEKVAKAELSFVAFMAEHHMPFRQADHLDETMKKMFPDSAVVKAISMKRTKASYVMQQGMAWEEQRDVSKICSKTNFRLLLMKPLTYQLVRY